MILSAGEIIFPEFEPKAIVLDAVREIISFVREHEKERPESDLHAGMRIPCYYGGRSGEFAIYPKRITLWPDPTGSGKSKDHLYWDIDINFFPDVDMIDSVNFESVHTAIFRVSDSEPTKDYKVWRIFGRDPSAKSIDEGRFDIYEGSKHELTLDRLVSLIRLVQEIALACQAVQNGEKVMEWRNHRKQVA